MEEETWGVYICGEERKAMAAGKVGSSASGGRGARLAANRHTGFAFAGVR